MTTPTPPQPSIGRQFVRLFFGTAKRIIVTTLVVAGLLIWLVPPLQQWFIGKLLDAVTILLAIGIVILVANAITGGKLLRRKKGGSKSH